MAKEPNKKAPRKNGRPSKFGTVDLDKVKQLSQRGWTDAEMSKFFSVALSTWHLWKIKHPRFSDSLKGWKLEADAKVERALFERAIGYSHPEEKIFNHDGKTLRAMTIKHYAPDTTAGIFWLKNRKPDDWRDKIDHEIITEVKNLTDDQLDTAIDRVVNSIHGT